MNGGKNPKGKSPTFKGQREKEEPLKERSGQRSRRRTRREQGPGGFGKRDGFREGAGLP